MSCVSCASDAQNTPDVNCDSGGNVARVFCPDTILTVTPSPGAILISIPYVSDVLNPSDIALSHPDTLSDPMLSYPDTL